MNKLKFKDVKVGTKYKMKNGTYIGNGYPKGTIVTVQAIHGMGNIHVTGESGNLIGVPLNALESLVQTQQEFEEQLLEYEAKIVEIKSKLAWMKKVKVDVYDETEFKVWQTLETLDSKATQIQKMKAIAALINDK